MAASLPSLDLLPTYQDVEEAADILQDVAHHTPIQTSSYLDSQLGVSVYIKCENLQRMGAFKFRGAYNALAHFTKEQREQGVLTYSSGNHAQAVALSSKLLNLTSTIIMPYDAPTLKVNATREYGGNVVFYDRYKESRDQVASELQTKTGATFIPPYNHKDIIAGQGTCAKELFEDLADKNVKLDFLFVCVGGGGLISGCSLAAKKFAPHCKVIGVEPEAGNDAQQSLAKGEIVHIDTPKTIADGAQTQQLGNLTFAIMQDLVDSIITVTDEELTQEMYFVGERMKLIVEPTGCLALAGLRKLVRAGQLPSKSNCGVVISGGNVDMERYCQLISSYKKLE